MHDKLILVVGRKPEDKKIIEDFEQVNFNILVKIQNLINLFCFLKIFEGIVNMAHIYIVLIKTGNILFRNWTATVYCNDKSNFTARINFGVKSENQNIFANRKKEKTTINSLNKTIQFLKKASDEWLGHIEEKRYDFSTLNFFQIDQIVMLRKYLANFIQKTNSSNLKPNENEFKDIFDLLYGINNEIGVKLLEAANNKAFMQYQNSCSDVANDRVDQEKQVELLNELSEYGFSK